MNHYMPPPPPMPPLFVLIGRRFQSLSREHRIAVGGVLLAQVLVLLLYLVLVDNMARAENKRLAQESYEQERKACRKLPTRLEREQCMITLGPSPAVLASMVSPR